MATADMPPITTLKKRHSLRGRDIVPLIMRLRAEDRMPPLLAGLTSSRPIDSLTISELKDEIEVLTSYSAEDICAMAGKDLDRNSLRHVLHLAVVFANEVGAPAGIPLDDALPARVTQKRPREETVVSEIGNSECQERICRLMEVLPTPPIFSTLRVNTLVKSTDEVCKTLQDHFGEAFEVEQHDTIPDALIIKGSGPRSVPELSEKVVVDLSCGMAVLRGANVFAQGIMAAPTYMQPGDHVSVYADIKGKCCKGLTKPFEEGPVHFVGNGITKISRHDLFCSPCPPSGLAIEMVSSIYHGPSLSDVPAGLVYPQNLPSIVCSHVLDPKPGENVLDMCAAPGGKTTHMACLMKNEGRVVAFDKSQQKIDKILKTAENWGLTNIRAYVFDGTRAVQESATGDEGPPFRPETFDKVLLDAPCSALGQRPNIYCREKLKQVCSHPQLQKKLFSKAVELLRVGGSLVYSTCTITAEENENLVAWALSSFPCLQLVQQVLRIGGPGLPGTKLTKEQTQLVQRFDPSLYENYQLSVNTDTIGFFCAKFNKS